MDHFYKVMRAMGQWEMLEEPSPKVCIALLCVGLLPCGAVICRCT